MRKLGKTKNCIACGKPNIDTLWWCHDFKCIINGKYNQEVVSYYVKILYRVPDYIPEEQVYKYVVKRYKKEKNEDSKVV